MRKRPVFYFMLRKSDGRIDIIRWTQFRHPEGADTRYMHSYSVGPFRTLTEAKDGASFSNPTRRVCYSRFTVGEQP